MCDIFMGFLTLYRNAVFSSQPMFSFLRMFNERVHLARLQKEYNRNLSRYIREKERGRRDAGRIYDKLQRARV